MIRYGLLAASFWFGSICALTPEQIDNFANETLHNWEIPGLALAVIQKDKETYIQGYGVRIRGSEQLVDPQTLFQINSLSKAFTALTVNMLVEEGKLDWDVPIHNYLNNFDSISSEISQHASLRDFLCHRTGFPGNLYEGWRLFRNTTHSIDDLIQRLAFVEPTFPFRAQFNYDNIGYALAGEVVAKTSGLSWASFCHQKILSPLKMNRTFISYSTFKNDDNSAAPHTFQTTKPITGYNWEKDSLEAASGINSCAQDMALWLEYCLNQHSKFSEIFKPQVIINPLDLLPEIELPTFVVTSHGQPHMFYCMGWWQYNLEQTTVYRHTGSSAGMQSALAIVPELGIGVVILSNQSKHPAVSALMNRILDNLLNRLEADWENQGLKTHLEAEDNKKNKLEASLSDRKENNVPSLSLEKYVGVYTHPGYGSISVQQNNSKMNIELIFCKETGNLEHWENDLFEIVNTPSGSLKPFLCEFLISDDEGKCIGLKIPDMGIFLLENPCINTDEI